MMTHGSDQKPCFKGSLFGRFGYFHESWLEGTFGDRRGEPGEVLGICRDTRAGYSVVPWAVR